MTDIISGTIIEFYNYYDYDTYSIIKPRPKITTNNMIRFKHVTYIPKQCLVDKWNSEALFLDISWEDAEVIIDNKVFELVIGL